MPNQIEQSRTSNALGVPIPQWIINQLDKRSQQLSVENQSSTTQNENLLFRANRSAWIRMVSSVDIIDPFIFFYNPLEQEDQFINLGENKAKRYFQDLGIDIKNASDLAKKFVLQGGVSTYANEKNNFSYNLREGFPDTYNVAGNQEVENYGYKPMPGITSVRVQTQGKLGSIRAAEIQLKVWDKAQLDIIDALYFKLGYTMFLEWGHTNYYKGNGEFGSTESYSIDPFQAGLTKEDIYNKVSNNIRESEGNYDAMLGMVTNFNFTYNQEGGYDCTIKMISLGVLISNMKMNNPRILPDLQESVIKKFVNTLTELEKQNLAKAKQAAEAEARSNPTLESSYPSCLRKFGAPTQLKEGGPYAIRPPKGDALAGYSFYNNGRVVDVLGKSVNYSCDGDIILINGKSITITSKEFKAAFSKKDPNTGEISIINATWNSNSQRLQRLADFVSTHPIYGTIYYISNLNGYIPLDQVKKDKYQLQLDGNEIYRRLSFDGGNKEPIITSPKFWEKSSNTLDYLWELFTDTTAYGSKAILKFFGAKPGDVQFDDAAIFNTTSTTYTKVSPINQNKYKIEIERNLFGISTNPLAIEQYIPITFQEYADALKVSLSDPKTFYKVANSEDWRAGEYVVLQFEIQVPISKQTELKGTTTIDVLGNTKTTNNTKANVVYNVKTFIKIDDSVLIKGIKILDPSYLQPSDFKGTIEDISQDANKPLDSQANQQETTDPALNANDIQKTEAEKYKSAFEVIIRTIQLYSLDNAIASNIQKDYIVKKLSLIQKDSANNQYNTTYKEFTKELFSVGLFADMLEDLDSMSKGGGDVEIRCKVYDEQMKTGTVNDKEEMLRIRALFGFHFGLLGNVSTAERLLKGNLAVNFSALMSTYTVPYEFNQGIVQGTQLNHPVYIPLGFVIMILNHMCTIYDNNKPVVYLDFNHKSNLCLSNAKHLSTNPYDVLIPFQGTDKDFESILEPTTLDTEEKKEKTTGNIAFSKIVIKPMSGSTEYTDVYTPRNSDVSEQSIRDRISGDLLAFKPSEKENEIYRGRTMNILISCDYLLRSVGTFTKSNGSGDVYVREFIEQILSDINKSLGDINVFRLAYDDGGNAIHIVDDQMTQNLEENYPQANESFRNVSNRSRLPLFGKGSIAKTLEIRTEISSKLSNMIAVSANANIDDQSNLSKSTDSFGFYNTSYKDRYIPKRTEYTSNVTLPTDTMIRSTIQFNEAIKTFYGDARPAEGSVGHATNYYIQRMSKIKSSEKGTRASAMIPVSLNFSMDGMSGFGMGQSFTIDNEFLPYTYNLSLTDPYGEQDRDRTVAFVMTGLDHTIEGNQWTSNVRTNMIYAKKQSDFIADKIKPLNAGSGLRFSQPVDGTQAPIQDTGIIKTSYPELPLVAPPATSRLSYTNAKNKLLTLTDEDTAKSVFAILWAEASKENNSFSSAGGYNYAGVQTDAGRWKQGGELFIGRFIRRDSERLREFAQFNNDNDFLKFMIAKAKAKNFTAINGEKWTERYLNSWVYLNLESKDLAKYKKTFPDKLAIFNTAINRFNSA